MINEATLVGRIGKKDFRQLKNGAHMACFSVATTKKYKESTGEKKTTTTWHNVNFFGNLADAAHKYIEVGDLVYIKGEINNVMIDKGNEKPQWYSSIQANVFKIIPTQGKANSNYSQGNESKGNERLDDEEIDDEEIPF